jgi:hypothetical protein
MTATMEYPNQVGILGISDGINSLQTNSSIKFADANGISFRLNGSTMSASYTVPGNTVFSNSNNVQFGLAGSTVTAIALFAQSTQTENMHNITLAGNTAGTMAQVSSGTLTLAGGNNVTLSQSGNHITIVGPTQTGANNFTLSGNTAGTLTGMSSGTITIAGGNNITLSQNGNAFTISGAAQGGVQTGISGIGGSNTTYTSGTVIWSGQNNITIGSYVSSNSQYIRLSVPNFLSTAAQSDHTHGSNVSTASTTGSDMKFTSASNGLTIGVPAWGTGYIATSMSTLFGGSGFTTVSTIGTDIVGTHNSLGLNLGVPKFITTAGLSTHTHGTPTLSLTNLTGSISSASNGLTLSMTAYPATSFVNVSEVGSIYFANSNGHSFSSSVSGMNTTIYIVT